MANGTINHENDTGWINCKASGVSGTLIYRIKGGVLYILADQLGYTAAANAQMIVGTIPVTLSDFMNPYAHRGVTPVLCWVDKNNGDIFMVNTIANPTGIAITGSTPI